MGDTPVAPPSGGASVHPAIADVAVWSEWLSWSGARAAAPRQPGVYLVCVDQEIVYVGQAGERNGKDGQRAVQGLWGRLGPYTSGKAATSGFGEAALDRALAEAAFVRARLEHLEAHGAQRTTAWAREAIAYWAPAVCWTTTSTGVEARLLELRVEALLRQAHVDLWNR